MKDAEIAQTLRDIADWADEHHDWETWPQVLRAAADGIAAMEHLANEANRLRADNARLAGEMTLPDLRCDDCDNGIEDEWNWCPWCGCVLTVPNPPSEGEHIAIPRPQYEALVATPYWLLKLRSLGYISAGHGRTIADEALAIVRAAGIEIKADSARDERLRALPAPPSEDKP